MGIFHSSSHLMWNLYVHSKYAWLKVTKYKIKVSFSPIFANELKPFYTHWYRRQGKILRSCGHLDNPNWYSIEKTCATVVMKKLVRQGFTASPNNQWHHHECYANQRFNFKFEEKCLLIAPFLRVSVVFFFSINCL